MTVLVAAASKHGATEEIAQRIGAALVTRGLDVDERRLRDVDDVGSYEAVVLGSAIYLGMWMKEATAFVEDHADELRERPTWLFASGPIVGNPPPADDPNAMRPALVEKLLAATAAREHKVFGGRLDRAGLSLLERIPARMAGGHDGDWRDWDAVDGWAGGIADELRKRNEP